MSLLINENQGLFEAINPSLGPFHPATHRQQEWRKMLCAFTLLVEGGALVMEFDIFPRGNSQGQCRDGSNKGLGTEREKTQSDQCWGGSKMDLLKGSLGDMREPLWMQRFWTKDMFVFPFLKSDRCLRRIFTRRKSLFLILSHTKNIHSVGQVGNTPEGNNTMLTKTGKSLRSSQHRLAQIKVTWTSGSLGFSCSLEINLWVSAEEAFEDHDSVSHL